VGNNVCRMRMYRTAHTVTYCHIVLYPVTLAEVEVHRKSGLVNYHKHASYVEQKDIEFASTAF